MNSYKIEISSTTKVGTITEGDVYNVVATYKKNDVAIDLSTATFETRIASNDGSGIIIPNAAHTDNDFVNGVANIGLSAAVTNRIRKGRKIWFHTKVTIGSEVTNYWGQLDEVREAIK